MYKFWDKVKIVLAVVLFAVGTLFVGVGVYGFSDSVGPAIVIIALGLLAFIYPVVKIIGYVSARRGSGKKWIALPAVAVSIPLLFSTCTGLMGGAKKTEEITSSQVTSVTSEETQSALNGESSSLNDAPTTVPTNTPTPVSSDTSVETTSEVSKALAETTKEQTSSDTTVAESMAEPEVQKTQETPAVTETEMEVETTPQSEIPPPSETPPPPSETPAEESSEMENDAPETQQEAHGAAQEEPRTTVEVTSEEYDYILNTSKMKFHYPDCPSVRQMSEKNKEERHCSREELINAGYSPCGNCHP